MLNYSEQEIEQYHQGEDNYERLESISTDETDFRTTTKCLWVLAITALMSGIVFVITGNKMIAVGIFGFVVVALTLVHIHVGILLLFCLLPLENIFRFHEYFTVSKVVGVIILLRYLPHCLSSKLYMPKYVKIMFIFLAWSMLSILWSLEPLYTLIIWVTLLLNVGILFIIINTVHGIKSFNLLVIALSVGAIISSVLINFTQAAAVHGSEEIGRVVFKESSSPNILGNSMALGFIGLCYGLLKKGKLRKILILGILPVVFLAIFKTQSRAALGGIILAPIIAFIISSKGQRSKYILLAVILAGLFYGSFKVIMRSGVISQLSQERLQMTAADFEKSGRLFFWRRAVQFFFERPITGYGLHNYAIRAAQDVNFRSVHSSYFGVLADLGIVGVGIGIGLYLSLFRSVSKLPNPYRWLGNTFLMYNMIAGVTSTTYTRKDFWYAMTIITTIICVAQNYIYTGYDVLQEEDMLGNTPDFEHTAT